MANKVTKREVINMMMAEEVINTNEVFMEFLKHELELLDRKSTSRKPTKTQQENEDIKVIILDALKDVPEDGATITELMKSNEKLGELTCQKISALMRPLINDGVVVKTTEKKVSRFKLA